MDDDQIRRRLEDESEERINERIVRQLVVGMIESGYSVRQILMAFHPNELPLVWSILQDRSMAWSSSSAGGV